jgi:FkbM family methyltransferase
LKNSGIFAPLQHFKNKTTIGIEPDTAESKRLKAEHAYDHMDSHALGANNGDGFLYVLKGTACSSTHEPNLPLLKAYDFRSFPLFQIDHTVPIQLSKLDDILPQQAHDFVKIDIQGSEYDVLSSLNSQFFESIICLNLEVRTIEIYQGEGTLEKVMAFLKEKGFCLLAFRDGDCEFLTECDLTFIRDPRHMQTFDQCLKHILAGFLVKRPQYIAYICRYYQRRFGEDQRLKAICKQIGTHTIPIAFSDGVHKRKMSKHSHY